MASPTRAQIASPLPGSMAGSLERIHETRSHTRKTLAIPPARRTHPKTPATARSPLPPFITHPLSSAFVSPPVKSLSQAVHAPPSSTKRTTKRKVDSRSPHDNGKRKRTAGSPSPSRCHAPQKKRGGLANIDLSRGSAVPIHQQHEFTIPTTVIHPSDSHSLKKRGTSTLSLGPSWPETPELHLPRPLILDPGSAPLAPSAPSLPPPVCVRAGAYTALPQFGIFGITPPPVPTTWYSAIIAADTLGQRFTSPHFGPSTIHIFQDGLALDRSSLAEYRTTVTATYHMAKDRMQPRELAERQAALALVLAISSRRDLLQGSQPPTEGSGSCAAPWAFPCLPTFLSTGHLGAIMASLQTHPWSAAVLDARKIALSAAIAILNESGGGGLLDCPARAKDTMAWVHVQLDAAIYLRVVARGLVQGDEWLRYPWRDTPTSRPAQGRSGEAATGPKKTDLLLGPFPHQHEVELDGMRMLATLAASDASLGPSDGPLAKEVACLRYNQTWGADPTLAPSFRSSHGPSALPTLGSQASANDDWRILEDQIRKTPLPSSELSSVRTAASSIPTISLPYANACTTPYYVPPAPACPPPSARNTLPALNLKHLTDASDDLPSSLLQTPISESMAVDSPFTIPGSTPPSATSDDFADLDISAKHIPQHERVELDISFSDNWDQWLVFPSDDGDV